MFVYFNLCGFSLHIDMYPIFYTYLNLDILSLAELLFQYPMKRNLYVCIKLAPRKVIPSTGREESQLKYNILQLLLLIFSRDVT